MALSIFTRNNDLCIGIPHITDKQKIIYNKLEETILDTGVDQILVNQLSETLQGMSKEHPELSPGKQFINKRTSELGLAMLEVLNNG